MDCEHPQDEEHDWHHLGLYTGNSEDCHDKGMSNGVDGDGW